MSNLRSAPSRLKHSLAQFLPPPQSLHNEDRDQEAVSSPAIREAVRRVVESQDARKPRVLGSVIHGDDADGSEMDILVDLARVRLRKARRSPPRRLVSACETAARAAEQTG